MQFLVKLNFNFNYLINFEYYSILFEYLKKFIANIWTLEYRAFLAKSLFEFERIQTIRDYSKLVFEYNITMHRFPGSLGSSASLSTTGRLDASQGWTLLPRCSRATQVRTSRRRMRISSMGSTPRRELVSSRPTPI